MRRKYRHAFMYWGDLMGKLVSSPGTLKTAPKTKGESMMGT